MKHTILVFVLSTILALLILGSCKSKGESTIHYRNFSKNVFEDEFATVDIACDTFNNIVLIPDTKWINIEDVHLNTPSDTLHRFQIDQKLKLTERTFQHELFLESIGKGHFMFRYNGLQSITDTIRVLPIEKAKSIFQSRFDSIYIFSFEGQSYYKLSSDYPKNSNIKTIYQDKRIEDKGRVIAKCDYYVTL